MAYHSSFSEVDFSCSVCHDIFKHPIVLHCSHTFCKACVQEWWTHKKRQECPVCKKISSVNPSFNRVLNNLCETFIKEKRLNREEGQASLKLLQEKLKIFTAIKTNCDRAAEQIKVQRRNTKEQIKEKFKKFHQFLQKEEEASITALREEEQQKSQMMRKEIEGLNRKIATLSNAIRAIEEDLKGERISFLQNYKSTMEGAQLQDPQLVSGALIDKAKHLDNLTFRVWDKMKNIFSNTPVILDPYTAHPDHILSNDLTSGRLGERQQLPDDPERSDSSSSFVMGSEGFNLGTHSWDVEVGDNRWWTVGVVTRDRGGRSWRLRLYHGAYIAQSLSGSFTVLSVKRKPRRIRIQLDWDRGTLSFSDPSANTHLHTFTHTFTDTLVPFIYNCDDTVPLKMLSNQY